MCFELGNFLHLCLKQNKTQFEKVQKVNLNICPVSWLVLRPIKKDINGRNGAIWEMLAPFSLPFKMCSSFSEAIPHFSLPYKMCSSHFFFLETIPHFLLFTGILSSLATHSINLGFQPILMICLLLKEAGNHH